MKNSGSLLGYKGMIKHWPAQSRTGVTVHYKLGLWKLCEKRNNFCHSHFEIHLVQTLFKHTHTLKYDYYLHTNVHIHTLTVFSLWLKAHNLWFSTIPGGIEHTWNWWTGFSRWLGWFGHPERCFLPLTEWSLREKDWSWTRTVQDTCMHSVTLCLEKSEYLSCSCQSNGFFW